MSVQESKQPTVITLDNTNSITILVQYIELGQQKGAYLLNEAEILKRAVDVLMNQVPDNDITPSVAKNILIQGVQKAQRHGAYTLNDASLLSKVVQFVVANDADLSAAVQAASAPGNAPGSAPASEPASTQAEPQMVAEEEDDESSDDLSDLADPIPLKPKEV